jgi:hypothetical protein
MIQPMKELLKINLLMVTMLHLDSHHFYILTSMYSVHPDLIQKILPIITKVSVFL